MARTRQQENAENWSCPLCTLLNTSEDDRCAACDNARPPAHQTRKSQLPEASVVVATAPEVQHIFRPTAGVFFSSLPRDKRDSGDTAAWRQEVRLVVNRRRGNWRRNVASDQERKVESERVETGSAEQNAGSTATHRGGEQETKAADAMQISSDDVESMVTMEKKVERQDEVEEEEEETATDVDEPCFNLLGSGASVFAVPTMDNAVEDPCATDETKSRDGSEEVDTNDDVVVVSSPPRYPGFMPASKIRFEEPAIDEKLASAGLDLSDSEEEEKEPHQLRQRKDEKEDSWEDKWVCQICTNLNDQTEMECSSCKCKRYIDTSRSTDTATGSNLRWACHICTNMNPPDATDCLMCLSTRKMNAGASNDSSDETWACSVCTTFNAPGTTQCEVCDRLREGEPKKTAGKSRECPVCTNINSPSSTRCEICDTFLQAVETRDDHFVDLSSSQPARKSSFTVDEDDLENPYADLSQYNDYDAPCEVADADSDFVEEISDHEVRHQPSMSLINPRPLTMRPELKEFEHFVCMEDLQDDYGCRINYNKMFAGQRSGKSYADRLATRQTQSRKRKRDAARKEAGQTSSSTSRGGKAARGSKKRKAAAAPRRASAGGAKATRAKRARKTGTPTRRTSSATTYSPGINHYDNSAADLGEDLSTMAWEGVGSAGYH